MFKNDEDREKKASNIAKWLGTADIHKIHGRPISYKEALEKGLKVELLENDQKLQEKVLSVFHASMASHDFTNCTKFVENHNGKGLFLNLRMIGKK